jgi:hypothetical protein
LSDHEFTPAELAGEAVPFSQDLAKPAAGSREAIIADIRHLVEAEPDKIITRNYYRVHGSYAESAWSQHFGTWAEAKRAANVTPSRHVQNHEKHVAKHASVERYRQMTDEKRGWEATYLRPDARRFQTHLVVTDIHDRDCDPFLRRVLMDTVARVQPTRIILGGDTYDLPEFSKYTQDPREWDVVGRIRWVHDFLADLRAAAPEAQIDMVEGNHEFRLLRHLAEATPAMRAVLADLHGFTVPKLLGLDAFEVNYLARADLATFNQRDITEELKRNYLIVDDAFVVHHFPEGRDLGYPGCNGHHHKHVVWPAYSPQFGSYTWHQLGCGHTRHASYCAGEKWSNGFLLAHVDRHRKHTQFEYIDLSFQHAVVGGKWFERMSSEVIG